MQGKETRAAHIDNGGWEHRLKGYRGTIAESHLVAKISPSQYPRMLVIGCGNGSEYTELAYEWRWGSLRGPGTRCIRVNAQRD